MDKSFKIFIILSITTLLITLLVLLRKHKVDIIKDSYVTNGKKPLKYIPKKIFQTISDKTKIAPEFQKNVDYIKNLNPDWEYKLFDDTEVQEYILKYYGQEYLKYYNMINPKYGPARADFFRYLLMYREGGAYFDIKSAMERPLNTIIYPDDEYILSYSVCYSQSTKLRNEFGEYQQWYIICRPNHPFLKAVIELVIENIKTYRVSDGVGKDGVLKLTGPIAYTEAIMPIVEKYNHRLIENNVYLGLIYNNLKKFFGRNPYSHQKKFFSTHYSMLKKPLIKHYKFDKKTKIKYIDKYSIKFIILYILHNYL